MDLQQVFTKSGNSSRFTDFNQSLSQLPLTLQIANFALALRGLCCERGDKTEGLTFLLSKICYTTHWKICSPTVPVVYLICQICRSPPMIGQNDCEDIFNVVVPRSAESRQIWTLAFKIFLWFPTFIHFVICSTVGPQPLPKRLLYRVSSITSSFYFHRPLVSFRSFDSCLRPN